MHREKSLRVLVIIIAFAGILLAQVYGCGNSTDRYVEKVLQRWPTMEVRSKLLVEGLSELSEDGGTERFWLLAGEARQAADSFRKDLDRKILVPGYQKKFNGLLTSFLSEFGFYMKGLQDYLDVAILGEEGELPDIENLSATARQALGDYQDAQEYNGAVLEEDVWGLAEALRVITVGRPGYAGPDSVETLETAPVSGPEEMVAAWYDLFNRGEGEGMYYLLSPYSPILEKYGVEDLINRVEEANSSGLLADCAMGEKETVREDGLDWAVVQVAVEYECPCGREEFSVELDYVDGRWMVTRLNSASGIW